MSWKLVFTRSDLLVRRPAEEELLLKSSPSSRGKDWTPCACDLVLTNKEEGLGRGNTGSARTERIGQAGPVPQPLQR